MSCNCACVYCYQRSDPSINKSVISSANLEKIFDYVREQSKISRQLFPKKPIVVELFGGEAFQNKTRQTIERIFSFCRKEKIVIFCTTNGVELASFFDLFASYRGYIDRVAITIDGGKDRHNKMKGFRDDINVFNDVIGNINTLLKFGIKVRVAINLGKDNLSQLGEYLQIARENGWFNNPFVQLEIGRIFDRYYIKSEESVLMESQILEYLVSIRNSLPSNIKLAFLKTIAQLAERFGWAFNQNEIGRVRFHYCWTSTCAAQVEYIDSKLDVYRCTCTTSKERYKIGNLNNHSAFNLEPFSSCNSLDRDDCWNCSLGGYCGDGCYVSGSVDKARFCREERLNFDYFMKQLVVPKVEDELKNLLSTGNR